MVRRAHRAQSIDTSPDAEAVQLKAWRAMSSEKKAGQISDLTRAVHELAMAGLRQRLPDSSEDECFLRAASLRLDRETMIRVYGWDPQAQRP